MYEALGGWCLSLVNFKQEHLTTSFKKLFLSNYPFQNHLQLTQLTNSPPMCSNILCKRKKKPFTTSPQRVLLFLCFLFRFNKLNSQPAFCLRLPAQHCCSRCRGERKISFISVSWTLWLFRVTTNGRRVLCYNFLCRFSISGCWKAFSTDW